MCEEVIYQLIVESRLNIQEVDYGLARQLLWFLTTREVRMRRGIEHLAPKRRSTSGRPPTIASVLSGNNETWVTNGGMSTSEERKVLASVVCAMVGLGQLSREKVEP